MTAKQYLKQIRLIDGRIRRNKERIQSLRLAVDGIKGIAYDKDKVQSSAIDTMSESVGKLVDLERNLVGDIVRLELLKTEATKKIHEINFEIGEEVLYLRWVQGESFYNISDSIGYSLPHTHRIHGKALQLMNEVLAPKHDTK